MAPGERRVAYPPVQLEAQKEVWPLFGYEGESFSHGGYIARSYNDIDWL